MLYNLGIRLFRNEEDALDFMQEFYLYAEKRQNQFEGKAKFSTWLYSMALNFGLNLLREKKKIVFENFNEDIEYYDEQLESSQVLINHETEKIVQEEFAKLPDTYRIPLQLLYYEELTYSDIAKKLAIKEGTLKSLIHRGKKILKSKIHKRGIL